MLNVNMSKTLRAPLALFGALVCIHVSSSASADGRVLSPEDLVEVSRIGLEEFKKEVSAETYGQVYAITTLRSADGDGATLKLYYGNPEEKIFASYFCHEHDPGELDCHSLGM